MEYADKILLSLAAKAVGISELKFLDKVCFWNESFKNPEGGHNHLWNPLDDDGQAFRLAVKLNIQITPGTYNTQQFSAYFPLGGKIEEYVYSRQDEYASTRRAIVRVAAEIGKRKTP